MLQAEAALFLVPILVAVFAAWGALWYRLGKLAGEVRGHNVMLSRIKKKVEAIAEAQGVDCE